MSDIKHLPIDDAPELAAALGRFMAHWGYLESQLMILLQLLLKIDNIKANFIYKEFISTKAKITLLRRINHFFTIPQSINNEIETLLSKADKLNSKRNSFIHALWVGDIFEHIMKIEMSLPKNHKQYRKPVTKITPAEVQKVVEEIAKLSQSFEHLLFQMIAVFPESHES